MYNNYTDFNKITVSNFLILICIFVTLISFFMPKILIFWMNDFFILNKNYVWFIVQFILYQFLHWWIFHLLSNSIFIYIFWNQIEFLIWKKSYILFFILNTIFTWLFLLFLSDWNTIWISGFAMAILAYIFLELKKRNNPEYKSAWIFLLINISIWFSSDISLIWHLFWAIFWIIYYIISSKNFKIKIYNFFK